MSHEVTDDVNLLPPRIVIITDSNRPQVVRIHADEQGVRVPFEPIRTVGDQGDVFNTAGLTANARLVECARLFIKREGLTGTDPESLALAAIEKPALKKALLALEGEL
jgi:hypothetical protein